MCGGGGSGGSGTQKYEWNDSIAPYWADALSWGKALTDPSAFGAYDPYPGQRIAFMNGDQVGAMDSVRKYVGEGGGAPTQAAAQQATDTLRGTFLGGNPYGETLNPYVQEGVGTDRNIEAGAQNPYINQLTATQRNQYAGIDSQPFRNVLQSGLKDITDAYQQGTAADTTRMFNLSGAFGGSAHEHAIANNQAALGKTIDNFVNPMLNEQLNRSAGLEENYLGRDLGNQQANRQYQSGLAENAINRRTGAEESYLGRDMQAQGQNLGIHSNLYEDMLNRGNQNYENERQRQVGAIGAGQNQQGLDFQRFQQLMGIGDIQRGYQQDFLNQNYQDWQEQQNQQYKMLDYFTGILGRAQGGMSPNMTTSQSGYQASPFSQILGAGLLGYGLTR